MTSLRQLSPVVRCAGDLTVALREADPASVPAGAYRVGPVAPLTRPSDDPVDAQRSDGVVWRRNWRAPQHMVIEFVDLALVDIDHASRRITFDRVLPDDVEEHLLLDHVVPMLLADRGLLVVHGAVASLGGAGVVLVGSSGAGKSTLAAYLWQHGWQLGSDDGAMLTPTRPPTVQPTYATLRLTTASRDLLGLHDTPVIDVVGKHRVVGTAAAELHPEPVPIRLIACLDPADETEDAVLTPLVGVAAHAELFGSMFHAGLSDPEIVTPVVEGLATIIETVHVTRLTLPRGIPGLESAERLLREACA